MLQYRMGWNIYLLHSLFSINEVQAIQKIPIIRAAQSNCWVWHFDKFGVYTIKSGYRFLAHQHLTSDSLGTSFSPNNNKKFGFSIWKCKVPQKLQLFLWRIMTNSL